VKHQLLSGLLALAFVVAAALAGDHRRAAMTGAGVAGLTAVAEIVLMGFATGRARNALQAAWVIFAGAFLVRLLLLALATVIVGRAGWNVIAFVTAFFVPFFALSAIEWGYLHSLRRIPGTHA
jgi:FtsH-binding integral membrane protein